MATKNTWATSSNLLMLWPGHLIPARACCSRHRSPLQDKNVCLIPCEPHYGGSCPQMGSSRACQVEPSINLARQGRRVVLRGGDIKVPFHESRLNWIHDPTPPPSRCLESTNAVPERKKSENKMSAIATRGHQQLLSPQLLPRNVG